MTHKLSKLIEAFEISEGPARRGPQFVELASAIEGLIRTSGVSQEMLLECLGPPDLQHEQDGTSLLVYYFDHQTPGQNRDEWYFHLSDSMLRQSGYNRRGINVLSKLKPPE